jgi:hypothetical protein
LVASPYLTGTSHGYVGAVAELTDVRRLGALTETIHAIVYFAPEPQERYAALGLRGYWRGYFASRAAALGPVDADVVTMLFGGFAPDFVARAIPSVWDLVTPAAARAARLDGATAALQRLVGADLVDTVLVDEVQRAGELTGQCIEFLPLSGRPMAAALAALDRPADPLAALWLDCSVLREHRGDAHLDAVAEAGLRWPEPHLLGADGPNEQLREFRGWDETTWAAAADRVGSQDREPLERRTDELAAGAYDALSADQIRELTGLLTPIAERVATELPYPNPMGLPRLG